MSWQDYIEGMRTELDAEYEQREKVLAGARRLIQVCSRTIRAIHRKEFDDAQSGLDDAKAKAKELESGLLETPRMLYAGYLQDAQKELVEAAVLWAIIRNQPWPSPNELGVSAVTYLHGAAEAASECRRTCLDELRADNLDEARRLMAGMEAVYDDLITFDYPDGLTGGLRRTTDALRAVIERTRADLTMTEVQARLRASLDRSDEKGFDL